MDSQAIGRALFRVEPLPPGAVVAWRDSPRGTVYVRCEQPCPGSSVRIEQGISQRRDARVV